MISILLRENTEELPGNGGSVGINLFERQEWPKSKEGQETLLIELCKLADKVDTVVCEFHVQEENTLLAKGAIRNNKEVFWKD